MPEQLAFARKASGLVRGLSMYDAFGIGIMTVQPIMGIWYMVLLGLGLFPGGNLLIAIGISAVTCGVFGPLVWGMLAGSMPRSGGEYIFNSRILHPAIALGASFAQVAAVIYWNFLISTWLAAPSLSLLAQYMGWNGLATWVTSKGGTFTLALVCLVAAFFSIAFGMRIYKIIQKPLVIIAVGGPILLAIGLFTLTKGQFIGHWNALATQYHSLDYQHFISAVRTTSGNLPRTWNWGDTIGATCGVFYLFIYNYIICYVGGEVKTPSKSLLAANWLTVWIPVVIGFVTVLGFYRIMSFDFLSASAVNDLTGPVKGYNLPFSSSYMTLCWIASGGRAWAAFTISLSFIVIVYLEVTIALMALTRASFAWGLDRMGPKWFSDISPRWASPMKLYLFYTCVLIVGTAMYVLWLSNAFAGLAAAGMQLVSVFGITAISAILLPYRKKVKNIWDSSPYRTWKVAGIPLLTIAGVVYLGYILVLLYFAFFAPQTRDITGKNTILFVAAWAAGIVWYFFWKARSKASGVDVSITYGELPPE